MPLTSNQDNLPKKKGKQSKSENVTIKYHTLPGQFSLKVLLKRFTDESCNAWRPKKDIYVEQRLDLDQHHMAKHGWFQVARNIHDCEAYWIEQCRLKWQNDAFQIAKLAKFRWHNPWPFRWPFLCFVNESDPEKSQLKKSHLPIVSPVSHGFLGFVAGGSPRRRRWGGGWRHDSAVPESIHSEVRLTPGGGRCYSWKAMNMAEFGRIWMRLTSFSYIYLKHLYLYIYIDIVKGEMKMVDLVWMFFWSGEWWFLNTNGKKLEVCLQCLMETIRYSVVNHRILWCQILRQPNVFTQSV